MPFSQQGQWGGGQPIAAVITVDIPEVFTSVPCVQPDSEWLITGTVRSLLLLTHSILFCSVGQRVFMDDGKVRVCHEYSDPS